MISAIHAGAGQHKCSDTPEKHCSRSLREHGGKVVEALMELEKDAIVNCGYGSNLTRSGRVECEAAYMNSSFLAFAAVGAVSNCMHPVYAARKLASAYERKDDSLWATIPPMVLVGSGAERYCESLNVGVVRDNSLLRSSQAERQHRRAKTILGESGGGPSVVSNGKLMDTAGAVSIQLEGGRAEACVSSGGIALKYDGRLGHSTQFGAAIWSEQCGKRSVAVTLSGCGEAISRTRLAERLATALLELKAEEEEDSPTSISVISDIVLTEFLLSRRLRSFPQERIQVGGLVLHKDEWHCELIAFHNTPQLPYALFDSRNGSVRQKLSSYDASTSLSNLLCEAFMRERCLRNK